jgi:excisionase family DNA binding protein
VPAPRGSALAREIGRLNWISAWFAGWRVPGECLATSLRQASRVELRAKNAPANGDAANQLGLLEMLAEPVIERVAVLEAPHADNDRPTIAALEAVLADARAAGDARSPLVVLAACLGRLGAPLVPSSTGAVSLRRARSRRRALPRLSVKPEEAAEMLGVSRDYLDEHIKPELRIVRRGSKTILIPVAELERWLEKSAARWA